jgi:two-component system, NtrC family, sensor histidine kinase KinB
MLRTRLYLGLLPLLLLFIAVSAVATLLYRNLAQSLEQTLTANYRAMIGGYEMRDAANTLAGAISRARQGELVEARAQYERERTRFQKYYMEQSLHGGDPERAALLETIDDAFRQIGELAREPLEDGGDASLSALRETEVHRFKLIGAIEELAKKDYADFQAGTARATRLARASINFLFAATVGAILLSVFLSYRLARSLLRPITALKDSAVALGEGRLDRDAPVTTDDELGELARTFNAMAAKLRDYRDAMNERFTRTRRTMEATLTSTPDPLFVIGTDGSHEVRNPAAEIIAALPDLKDGLPSALAEPLRHVMATGTHYLPTGYEHVLTLHVEGGERHYLPRILAIGDTLTGFGGAAVILQDVTKFRLLDDVKSNLVSTVSHELKTPLTGLLMAIHILLEQSFGAVNEKQSDLLIGARDDAERLLRILNDLLDMSRLEGGASLKRKAVSVLSLLEDRAREMKALVEAADQAIVVKAGPGLGEITVDEDRLRHVFINLLANASKYSGPSTSITLYAETGPEGFIRFGVRDQGPGIPPESVPNIFDRFYRVPDQRQKGAGLGLAIAREIVVAHGGSIACSSKVGEGSDFYFLLPSA